MTTYKIVRFYRDSDHPDHRMLVNNGLTLEEAQAWCSDESTSGDGWFDGYEAEDTSGSWDTSEVQLWLANDEAYYRAMLLAHNAEVLACRFTGMPGPNVNWSLVDWSAVFEHFEEDREESI